MRVKRLVWGEAEPLRLIALLGLPALVAASAFALRLVSSEVLDVLVVWTAASFPVGVLVGHCMLREH
jgi:hypothetical protein